MKIIEKTINILTKNNNEPKVDKDEFISCFNNPIIQESILTELANIFELLRTAMTQSMGIQHVTLKELRTTIDTMNNVFDDGIGVEKSFITSMVGESNDMSAFILSPFKNSELWVIQLHDNFGGVGELGAHGMNCVSMHENIDTGDLYMVGVIVIGPIDDQKVFTQVLQHEATHYLLEYTRTFVDKELINRIDCVENFTEFLADYLQFIVYKSDKYNGYCKFEEYAYKHFNDRVLKKYKPFMEILNTDCSHR